MLDEFNEALSRDDACPKCLGELDTGWECNNCGFDAMELASSVPPSAIKKFHAMVAAAKEKQK